MLSKPIKQGNDFLAPLASGHGLGVGDLEESRGDFGQPLGFDGGDFAAILLCREDELVVDDPATIASASEAKNHQERGRTTPERD